MLYLISDIHGNKIDFIKLLKKINFDREKDKMIILGDIVDRGPDGIELINYIKSYIEDNSMILLMGNHELFLMMYLKGELSEKSWISYGGEKTYNKVNIMSAKDKAELLEFIESLPYYLIINSHYFGDTVVTHTGVDCDNYIYTKSGLIDVAKSIERAVERNRYNFMVGKDIHYIPRSDKEKFDKYLIVGHEPCYRLNQDKCNSFYRTPYYMDIDAGSGHKEQGGVLGCYCVTTDEEIYITC